MSAPWQLDALCALFPDLPWLAEPEDRSRAAIAAMSTICAACPVRRSCEAYVDRANIVGGFWAGEDRTPLSNLSSSDGAA